MKQKHHEKCIIKKDSSLSFFLNVLIPDFIVFTIGVSLGIGIMIKVFQI